MKLTLILILVASSMACIGATNSNEIREGGIIRGPKDKKKIALEFTSGGFAEGGTYILDQLAKHGAKASFFFTGDYFSTAENRSLARRLIDEGHYLGAHSDTHPLYCPWKGPKTTLITKEFFVKDLDDNLAKIEKFGLKRAQMKYWIPPFEHYNEEIASWSRELGLILINFTPGTRSNSDYTEDNAENFVPSQVIYESILRKEEVDGLNGFLLLLHFGVGPKRTDKMHERLGDVLDYLQKRGYEFVRVDQLLD